MLNEEKKILFMQELTVISSQSTFTFSKLRIETLEQGEKYVQS